MVQTTKQVPSHWLFWKLKSSKILFVIILQKKGFWLLKCLPRAILCLPCCYDKHQGRKKSASYRRETVSCPPFKSESSKIKGEPSKSFRNTVLFYIRTEFSSRSLAKTFKGSKRDWKKRTTQSHYDGMKITYKGLLFCFSPKMFQSCCLISQNVNFKDMARNKYNKVVAQQNCAFEKILKSNSQENQQQTKMNQTTWQP